MPTRTGSLGGDQHQPISTDDKNDMNSAGTAGDKTDMKIPKSEKKGGAKKRSKDVAGAA